MAGRAGRRLLMKETDDACGHVIILPNLVTLPPVSVMEQITLGRPPSVKSHFMIDYSFVLRGMTDSNGSTIATSSLWKREADGQIAYLEQEFATLTEWASQQNSEEINEFRTYSMQNSATFIQMKKCSQRQQKALKSQVRDEDFLKRYQVYQENVAPRFARLEALRIELDQMRNHLTSQTDKILRLLKRYEYIDGTVTVKGILATKVNHCQELLLVEMFWRGLFDGLDEAEIAGILSMFSEERSVSNLNLVQIPVEYKKSKKMVTVVKKAHEISRELERAEHTLALQLATRWELCDHLIDATIGWIDKRVSLTELASITGLFAGNLIREFVRISHLSGELAELARITDKGALLQVVEKIPHLIIRDQVTVESLYVAK
jgi:superfamily II RNA helicase